MKKLKIIPEKIIEHTIIDKIICDICNCDVRDNQHGNSSEVFLGVHIGDNWPEGDCKEGYVLDCCDKCFFKKVKPLLEEKLGVKFREFDVEDDINERVDRG